MTAILLFANAIIAVLLIILILLQRNDPASGGMFGGTGGGSQAVIRNPLARPTAFLAAVFLINCLAIAFVTKGHEDANTIMKTEAAPQAVGVSGTVPGLPDLPAALGGTGANPGAASPTVPASGSTIVSGTAK